jgi:hypothetical protein
MKQPDKGFKDNRRPHVQKIDSNGNLKPHPLAKPKNKMSALEAYNKEAGARQRAATAKQAKEGKLKTPTTAPPKPTRVEKASEAVGRGLKAVKEFWDYDDPDKRGKKKR